MELFEKIRREHAAGETIRTLSKKNGVHRRMVRQALAEAIPPERKKAERLRPKLDPLKERIGCWRPIWELRERHTAHRIWTRLCAEDPAHSICEASVRRYVAERKLDLGLKRREVFIPQSYGLGEEGQVDWFEAVADLCGERRKLQFFSMRSMASGDAFHRAYTNAAQHADSPRFRSHILL